MHDIHVESLGTKNKYKIPHKKLIDHVETKKNTSKQDII